MTDYFAALDEPRRPWIDPGPLKQKFLALSTQFHPDRVHQAPAAERTATDHRYSELNAAYNCLRDAKPRLRHLLELERGAKPADIQNIPAEMMDFFVEVGRLGKEVDAFLTEQAKVTSPVLKVQWFERGQEWTDQLRTLQGRINARLEALATELKALNPVWESTERSKGERETLPLARLEEIYRLLGYLGRWSEQIQERIVLLSL